MKMLFISLAALLSPMVLSAASPSEDATARQEYIKEKTALLSEIYRLQKNAYDTGIDGDLTKVRQAQELLLKFRRDHADDQHEKIQCQKALVNALEEECQSVEKHFKAGTRQVVDVLQARLALIDAREDLRKLEQEGKPGAPSFNR